MDLYIKNIDFDNERGEYSIELIDLDNPKLIIELRCYIEVYKEISDIQVIKIVSETMKVVYSENNDINKIIPIWYDENTTLNVDVESNNQCTFIHAIWHPDIEIIRDELGFCIK
jgi:hypothetical protein